MASQPLLPAEARVRSLRTGEDHLSGGGWRSDDRWRQAHLKVLVSYQLHTGTPIFSAAPIAPEQGGGTHWQRMQQHTHLARLGRGVALPLTRLAQWARAAVANAGRIDHAQTAIGFLTPLLGVKRQPSGTAQRPIWLERKVGSSEAPRFLGGSGSGWTIPGGGRGRGRTGGSWLAGRWDGGSKFGRAQGRRFQPMP
jgi:hypothetical protein